MELDKLCAYLLAKKGAIEERPFGPEALVFKVMGKMFALVAWEESPLRLTLKCEPEHALALREMHQAIQPGYHMNKRHWNSITLDGTIPDAEIWAMIDHSYDLVVKGLSKADRQKLQG